ncbi:MAG: hypothetical protein J1F11_02845 [Oscillospiraceae bacterium]|nr:hypothetical protein [Oscillospiraceae bacterium]
MPDRGILQAEQRVREMNRMTQHYAEQGSRYMQSISVPPPRFEPMPIHNNGQDSPSVPEPRPGQHPEHREHRNSSRPAPAPFGIESDKLLLMALIYLLIKENADIKLIIALGYLLL